MPASITPPRSRSPLRGLVAVALALGSGTLGSGCAAIAAASGARPRAVEAAAELDDAIGAVVTQALGDTVVSLAIGGGEDPGPTPTGRTFLCWISQDGGEEIWADDAAGARAVCQEWHGAQSDPRHCSCEQVLALHAARR